MHKLILTVVALLAGVNFVYSQRAISPLLMQDDAACKQWTGEKLARMSLRDRVAQLFFYKLAQDEEKVIRKQIVRLAKKQRVGGILFSAKTAEAQVRLATLARAQTIPLLTGFEGERGLGIALKGAPVFPDNAALGCITDAGLMEAYGQEIARELKEVGMVVNFAPVADVNTNPKNPVINVRAFGDEPHRVAERVVAYSRGLESGGVLSVAKHFPGHGDSSSDSHEFLPTIYYNRERLDSVELYPFRKTIEAGISGVLTGHLRVPALESSSRTAASLSQSVVGGLLKQELGFTGLTFSDDISIKSVCSEPDVAVKALLAGNDMILISADIETAINSVLKAVSEGRLSKEEIDSRCRKVLAYKYGLGLNQPSMLSANRIGDRLNTAEAQELASRMRLNAITVAGNYFNAIPLVPSDGKIGLLSIGAEGANQPFISRVTQYAPVECFRWTQNTSAEECRKTIQAMGNCHRVIVCLTADKESAKEYLSLFAQLNLPVPAVYTFFAPYTTLLPLEQILKTASAVVVGHSGEEDIQRQVADILFARVASEGKLSMRIGRLFTSGEGSVVTPGMSAGIVPEDYKMSSYRLHRIDSVVQEGLAASAFPGCQVLVLRNGMPVYNRCFGTRSDKETTPVRPTDMFDLGGLTETTATLLAIMKLYDQGKLKLNDKISQYLPAFRSSNKKNLTIRELLLHESGLVPYIRFYRDAIDEYSVTGPFNRVS